MTAAALAARVLDAAFRVHGTAAAFTPQGLSAGAVRVIVQRGTAELRPGFSAPGRADTLTVELRAADLAALGADRAPQAGDVLTLDGEDHPVKSARASDRFAQVWEVDLA